MAKHLIEDKEISDGQTGTYTDQAGKKHTAVIKLIHPVYHADIEATIDGSTKYFAGVPFGGGEGGSHVWSHASEEDEIDGAPKKSRAHGLFTDEPAIDDREDKNDYSA